MSSSGIFLWSVLLHVMAVYGDLLPILMPNTKPTRLDTHLCTAVKVDQDEDYYVVGFRPNASQQYVHHMLLVGCEWPGSFDKVWDCGEMTIKGDGGLEQSLPCYGSIWTIYEWGLDAPKFSFPPDVALRVGKKTKSSYVVLQVHYADVSFVGDDKIGDSSGVVLEYTKKPQPKSGGVFTLGAGGRIPPMSTVHMESACRFEEDYVLHPFAFRTHTHSLGRQVAGYRVRPNRETGELEWTLIGKQNPQLPQTFYPIEEEGMTIRKGDILASRCTTISDRTDDTYFGLAHHDEMCKFNIMYWIEGLAELNKTTCFTPGPPEYYWSTDNKLKLYNIPDDDYLSNNII